MEIQNNVDVISSEDSASNSEDENVDKKVFDLQDIQERLIDKEMKRRKMVDKVPKIQRSKLVNAVNLLTTVPNAKSKNLSQLTKRYIHMQRYCITRHVNGVYPDKETAWFSPTYIMEMIRMAILTGNWNCVTHLLLILLKHNKRYSFFIKQVTLLMFMSDPRDMDGEFLNELVELYVCGVHRHLNAHCLVTLLMFMSDPRDVDGEFLNELVELCKIKL